MSSSTDREQLEKLISIAKEKQDKLKYYLEDRVEDDDEYQGVSIGTNYNVNLVSGGARIFMSDDGEIDLAAHNGVWANGTRIA